jgi:hypothetical protein
MNMFDVHAPRVRDNWLQHFGLLGATRWDTVLRVAPTSNAVSSCRNRSERPASTQRAVSLLNPRSALTVVRFVRYFARVRATRKVHTDRFDARLANG